MDVYIYIIMKWVLFVHCLEGIYFVCVGQCIIWGSWEWRLSRTLIRERLFAPTLAILPALLQTAFRTAIVLEKSKTKQETTSRDSTDCERESKTPLLRLSNSKRERWRRETLKRPSVRPPTVTEEDRSVILPATSINWFGKFSVISC